MRAHPQRKPAALKPVAARAVVGLALLLSLAAIDGCRRPAAESDPSAGTTKQGTVALVVDFGNGHKREFARLPWREGLTVIDLLVLAEAGPAGLKVKHRGSGQTAFVEAIDSVRNGGAGADGRNWLFFVNDRQGVEGAGVTVLQPGDRVLWKYASQQ